MRSSEPRASAVDLGGAPGPLALLAAASVDPASMSEEALLDVIDRVERSASWVASLRATLIAEYASREVSEPRDDAESRAMDWHREQLAAVCQTSPWEAHVRAETSLALRDRLPATASALRTGSLPWAQAVALARESADLAPAESALVERTVLADPRAVSVRQVATATRRAVARPRPARADEVDSAAHDRRRLVFWPPQDGVVTLLADLTVEAAATVAAALEPLALRTGADDDRTAEQRRADALVRLATGDQAPRVHVHVLARGGFLSGGHLDREPVGGRSLRRMSCDAEVTVHPTRRGGQVDEPVQTRRFPGPGLHRRLDLRDQGCRFPGCPAGVRRCHAHHLRHWADGGPTTPDNLVSLCPRHHHLVHEGGWRAVGPPEQLTWFDRDGRRYDLPPPSATVPPWADEPPMEPPPMGIDMDEVALGPPVSAVEDVGVGAGPPPF